MRFDPIRGSTLKNNFVVSRIAMDINWRCAENGTKIAENHGATRLKVLKLKIFRKIFKICKIKGFRWFGFVTDRRR